LDELDEARAAGAGFVEDGAQAIGHVAQARERPARGAAAGLVLALGERLEEVARRLDEEVLDAEAALPGFAEGLLEALRDAEDAARHHHEGAAVVRLEARVV